MAQHNEVGKAGEELAVMFLTKAGYQVIKRNWRYSKYEIDLIAVKDGMLHFVEVKTRTSSSFGPPDEEISRKKIRTLIDAGEEFLEHYPFWKLIQFDVLAITCIEGEEVEYLLIEDVYI